MYMAKTLIPKGYKSCLGLYETQTAIGKIKTRFEENAPPEESNSTPLR